ncbi:MAG: xylulokinase [Marmoricola sp.]
MPLVAGVDCSTQSTKVLVCDVHSGAVVREGRAPHPDLTEVDPREWWSAWQQASSGLLDGVEALAVGGQQHGMVLLDDDGVPVRDALLWNDNRSADAAAALLAELGGPAAWADATGSVPLASFTVSKLRWVAEHEPGVAARASAVQLPHDFLTHRLRAGTDGPTTDRGDASGTGYWSADAGYRDDLLTLAFGRALQTPRVAAPAEVVGTTTDGVAIAPGTGDNMAAALGLELQPGDIAVSLGTSGTVFARSGAQTHDPEGVVAGFADATGGFLPLVCTLNAARVLQAAVTMAGASLEDLDRLALSVPDAGGLVLLPYLDGERTPYLPEATGLLHGLTRHNTTPAHLVRAAVEGLMCGLADAVDALREQGLPVRRVVLIGGAARSRAVRRIAGAVLGAEVFTPDPGEYVALGAARQAAWALSGSAEPPHWSLDGERTLPEDEEARRATGTRESYRQVLSRAGDLLEG